MLIGPGIAVTLLVFMRLHETCFLAIIFILLSTLEVDKLMRNAFMFISNSLHFVWIFGSP